MTLVDHLSSTGQHQIIMMQKKSWKKLGNWSALENMTTSRNTSLVFLNLSFKVCLKTLMPGKKLPILPTRIWKNLIFKYYSPTITILIQTAFIYAFPQKIRKKNNAAADIDADLIIMNNFYAHFVTETSITKNGSDKELIPTFSFYEIYQYSEGRRLKHLPMDT